MMSTAVCWGANGSGQLGDGTTTAHLLAAPVKNGAGGALTGFTAIGAGRSHACGPLSSGTAVCWGLNNQRQIGDGTLATRLLPTTVKNSAGSGALTGLNGLSTQGDQHSCAVMTDGTARCWGTNVGGELGDGSATTRTWSVTVGSF